MYLVCADYFVVTIQLHPVRTFNLVWKRRLSDKFIICSAYLHDIFSGQHLGVVSIKSVVQADVARQLVVLLGQRQARLQPLPRARLLAARLVRRYQAQLRQGRCGLRVM